jgi:hypothetical protein
MEDESRPLPPGWVRQYDAKEHHQFFVDTNKNPPRSIWQHPYDDDVYMNSLSPEERAKIQGLHRVPTDADIAAESSDDDTHHEHVQPELPPRPSGNTSRGSDNRSFGRRMKDKLTGTTHEERARERAQREEEERQAYERHQMYRAAMAKAMETGQPQFIGKDRTGRDVYIEPPSGMGYGSGYPGQGGYGNGGYGYNPYSQGPYTNPNARFIRPQAPYSRPYYGGYGGGLGLPIGLGLGGGLLMGSMMGGE